MQPAQAASAIQVCCAQRGPNTTGSCRFVAIGGPPAAGFAAGLPVKGAPNAAISPTASSDIYDLCGRWLTRHDVRSPFVLHPTRCGRSGALESNWGAGVQDSGLLRPRNGPRPPRAARAAGTFSRRRSAVAACCHVAAVDGEEGFLLAFRQSRVGADGDFGGGSRAARASGALFTALHQARLGQQGFCREIQGRGDGTEHADRWFVKAALYLAEVGVRDVRSLGELPERELGELPLSANELAQ